MVSKKFLIVVILFSILYSCLSIVRHAHFQSGAFDLGIYDQAVWQYSHFLYPFNTIKMRMVLGDHLTLTLPLLAPLFWIWNNVIMLLIFQAVWISLSSYGICLYLRKRGFSELEASILAFLYLTFYGIQFGVFFDFHPVLIGVGLMAWILYFWEAEKWKLFWISTILLLLTQENMGLALFALCLIWFFQKKRLRLVLLLAGIGLVSSLIAFKTIPFFSNAGLEYTPHISHNPVTIVKNLFDAPEKREVWLYSFSWYSFLPLFSPGALLAYLSDVAQYFVTGKDFARMWSPFMHHRAILSIYLLAGTADVLLFLKTKKLNITMVTILMLFIAFGVNYHFHFALDKLIKKDFWQQEQWMKDNEDVIKHIPQNASVVAQQSLVPHIAHRQKIYLLYPRFGSYGCPIKNTSCWWLDFAGRPQYLFVDAHDNEWLTMTLTDSNTFRNAIQNMEAVGKIRLVYHKGESQLFMVQYP